jgi:hypothetical protein
MVTSANAFMADGVSRSYLWQYIDQFSSCLTWLCWLIAAFMRRAEIYLWGRKAAFALNQMRSHL